jgi:multimeric flavodoxin WrbA
MRWRENMAKKIAGIVGSYRKGRVIDTAVSEILKGAEAHGAEICKIYLIDKHIEFCTNCRNCARIQHLMKRVSVKHTKQAKNWLHNQILRLAKSTISSNKAFDSIQCFI